MGMAPTTMLSGLTLAATCMTNTLSTRLTLQLTSTKTNPTSDACKTARPISGLKKQAVSATGALAKVTSTTAHSDKSTATTFGTSKTREVLQ